jgi:hypothetical protein
MGDHKGVVLLLRQPLLRRSSFFSSRGSNRAMMRERCVRFMRKINCRATTAPDENKFIGCNKHKKRNKKICPALLLLL